MTRDHGPQIKDDEAYEALRKQGASKEKAARIANAQANPDMHPSEKGGHAGRYEDRSKKDLYEQAKRVGIGGRSTMSKAQLIDALRNH